jgi:hypothetical protein
VSDDRGMLLELDGRFTRMQEMVGIEAVNDFDVVPAVGERASQTAHRNSIAAEAVRRVKGGQMKEVERPGHADATFSITSTIWRAALSQVSE